MHVWSEFAVFQCAGNLPFQRVGGKRALKYEHRIVVVLQCAGGGYGVGSPGRVALHGYFGQQVVAQVDGFAADGVGSWRGACSGIFFFSIEIFEVYFELNTLRNIHFAFIAILGLYVIIVAASCQHG